MRRQGRAADRTLVRLQHPALGLQVSAAVHQSVHRGGDDAGPARPAGARARRRAAARARPRPRKALGPAHRRHRYHRLWQPSGARAGPDGAAPSHVRACLRAAAARRNRTRSGHCRAECAGGGRRRRWRRNRAAAAAPGHVICFTSIATRGHLWHFAPMNDELPLAAEFPPTSQAEWRTLVEAALKGASFEKRLTSQTYDGLRIEPLYARAVGAKPVAGRAPGAAWTLMQRVDHPEPAAANAQALQDLENGANGLTLVFAGSLNANSYGLDASPETLARVLDGIELDAGISIDFNLSPATRTAVQHFAAFVKSRKLPAGAVDLRASINPIGGFAASGATPMPWRDLSKIFATNICGLAEQGFRGPFAVADGRIIHLSLIDI